MDVRPDTKVYTDPASGTEADRALRASTASEFDVFAHEARRVTWDGFYNARDLGRLPIRRADRTGRPGTRRPRCNRDRAMLAVAEDFDAMSYFSAVGVAADDIAAVRSRLTDAD
jgi:hypothetical protein